MVSESTYGDIWDGLLEVSRVSRYFALNEQKFRTHGYVVRGLLAITGCAAVLSIFEFVPNQMVPFFGALIVCLVIYELLVNPTKTAIQLSFINIQFSELEVQYRNLWEKVKNGQIDDKEALEEKHQFMTRITQLSSLVDIGLSDKINKKAQTDAFSTEESRYAG